MFILQVRLLARVIRDGKRVGLHLEKAKQDRIKEINSKMSSLGKNFETVLVKFYPSVDL